MANVAIPAPEAKAQAVGTRRGSRSAYLFLLPWILGVLLLTVVPMATSLYLSFTRYFLGTDPQFIGLTNYQRMLSDPRRSRVRAGQPSVTSSSRYPCNSSLPSVSQLC